MKKLENSYCVPKTEWEWSMLAPYYPQELRHYHSIKEWMHDFTRCGHVNFMKFYPNLGVSANNHGRTEIPVQHFVDLVEDKITHWRLEEVSFRSTNPNDSASNVFFKRMSYMASVHVSYMDGKLHDISIEPYGSEEVASIDELNISTFTDLLTLIKFLTPPTK